MCPAEMVIVEGGDRGGGGVVYGYYGYSAGIEEGACCSRLEAGMRGGN